MSPNNLESLNTVAMLVAVQMPDSGNPESMSRFISKVKDYLSERGMSQAEAARRIGLSRTVISRFLGGGYSGDLRAVAEKLTNYINADYRQNQSATGPGFVSTRTAQKIKSLIAAVEAFQDSEGRIGVIIGDAGSGKTACLRAYAETDRNAYYVSHHSAQRVNGLLVSIMRAVTGLGSMGSLASISGRLIESLRHRRFLVLIDEASSLRAIDLDRLRTVLCVQCRGGLILAGNNELLETLRISSYKGGYACLDQFSSRLAGILNLDALAADGDGGPLYPVEDLRRLFEFGGITLTRDAVDVLGRICRMPRSGRMRTCLHIIRTLHTSREIKRLGHIDAAAIYAAVEYLHLPNSEWLLDLRTELSAKAGQSAAG